MNLLQPMASPSANNSLFQYTMDSWVSLYYYYILFKLNRFYQIGNSVHPSPVPILIMQKSYKIKYGLKNASAYLQKFKRQRYQKNQDQDSINDKQETFDNCQIPSSKESPERLKIKEEIMAKPSKFGKSTISSTDNMQELPSKRKSKYGLADLVIKNHLSEKLKIYEEDLAQLEENRENYILAIEEISAKIEGLHDMQDKNQILELQNFKNKKQILSLIKKYHELKLNLQIKKIKIQENFIKKKDRIKSLLEVLQPENQYVVEAQSWNFYYQQLLENKQNVKENENQRKVLEEILGKLEDGQEDLKKKEKSKNKIDKSGLLGDLKSFAKNFKMPNPAGQPNQV